MVFTYLGFWFFREIKRAGYPRLHTRRPHTLVGCLAAGCGRGVQPGRAGEWVGGSTWRLDGWAQVGGVARVAGEQAPGGGVRTRADGRLDGLVGGHTLGVRTPAGWATARRPMTERPVATRQDSSWSHTTRWKMGHMAPGVPGDQMKLEVHLAATTRSGIRISLTRRLS